MGGYSGAWGAKSRRIEPAMPGRCTRCGTHLSIYRGVGETQCAPCEAARSHVAG
jgi:hypothetical protein